MSRFSSRCLYLPFPPRAVHRWQDGRTFVHCSKVFWRKFCKVEKRFRFSEEYDSFFAESEKPHLSNFPNEKKYRIGSGIKNGLENFVKRHSYMSQTANCPKFRDHWLYRLKIKILICVNKFLAYALHSIPPPIFIFTWHLLRRKLTNTQHLSEICISK